MMRVGFNARGLTHPSRRGFNRYTWSLARALAAVDGIDVVLLSDAPIHSSFLGDFSGRVVVDRAPRHIVWEQAMLPRRIRELRLDVFHAPASNGLPLVKPCAYVLTIHDVIGMAAPHLVPAASLIPRVHHWARLRIALSRADALVTGSEHSKRDIVRWLSVGPERVTVIPDGADARFRPVDAAVAAEARARYGLAGSYVLYVGGFDRRKNVDALIEGFARSRAAKTVDLALAGDVTTEVDVLQQRARACGVEPRFLGYVPDEDLPALYSGAAVFVYPSLYEGFGLQLVEAMACGAPVAAANRTSLPEVLDGAGLLIDPENRDDIAGAIDTVLFDGTVARTLRERGLAVARNLTWERAASRTQRLYEDVLRRPPRPAAGLA